MPRVSRPALPASERKQGVWAVSLIGSCDSATTSSRTKLVSGTSLVGNEVQRRMVGHGFAVLAALLRGEQVAFELGQLAGAVQLAALTM
jgi:hypothetical protein